MSNSEEFLASLGFDTSDVDKAVQQTVTLLGHLGSLFPQIAAQATRAETAISKEARAVTASTQATTKAATATTGHVQNLARLRYALYDVSNVFGIAGAAALAFAGGIIGTGVAYEREFADVRRTVGVTGTAADGLYNKFLRLSTQIPKSFAELTQIGALAGQLGIAENRVSSFTKTTAEFAATTNVTSEAAATAFGRLDQLIDGVDGKYANLASSILNVGVNSVATESQIIGIASQIAATGNQAGLTADEIVGLSGSLASLGIAPEAARGTILRVFSQINSAVSQGGAALNEFAQVSNMSASEFRNGWRTDFTSTFLAFLRGINANGGDAEQAIRALGITATRDVNALLKLSQNTQALQRDLGLAASGFADASILSNQFGVIAETNASRLQVLIQTVQALAATMGAASSGPLSGFIQYLQGVLDGLLALSKTDIGQGIGFVGTAISGVIGVTLLLTAVAFRAAGSVFAMRTAMGELQLESMLAAGGLKGFTASALGAAGAAGVLRAALISTGIGAAVVVGFTLIGAAVTAIGEAMQTAEDRATSYFGTLDGLSDAVKADNKSIFDAQAQDARTALDGAATSGGSWVEVLQAAAKAQAQLSGDTDSANAKINDQTLKIGDNTREWLRNALASNENFRKIFANYQQLEQFQKGTVSGTTVGGVGFSVTGFEGFDTTKFAQLLTSSAPQDAQRYLTEFEKGLQAAADAQGQGVTIAALIANDETLKAAHDAAQGAVDAYATGISEAAQSGAISDVLDQVFGQSGDSAEALSATFKQTMADVYGLVNAEADLASNSERLGAAFANNGAAVAASGSEMQAVISSIFAASSGSDDAAARLQGFFNALVQGGYASASQLSGLQTVIASLTGGKVIQGAAFDMNSFAKGLNSVTKAAGGGGGGGGAAAAIRTLVDYANDLRSVFNRAYDIRFGPKSAYDDVVSSWQKISDSIAETNQRIAEYQAKLQKLTADRAVKAYFLSVAEAYGDMLRAGELRADISSIDSEMASTQGDLTKAQQKNSKTLVGNSAAAIQNRAEILNLVKQYQTYLASLAASGASQATLQAKAAQLKQEFLSQASQLGYNRQELGTYAAAFDDVSTAIARVPRNITVTANTNPALQALNELQAKLSKISGGSYSPKIIPIIKQPPALKLLINGSDVRLYRAALEAGKITAREYYQILYGLPTNPYGFKTGGFTGYGNPNKVAGVVHYNEGVLTPKGLSAVGGIPGLNAANQGRAPYQPAQVRAGAVASAPTVMDLGSTTMRELLEAMAAISFGISYTEVGQAVEFYQSQQRSTGG